MIASFLLNGHTIVEGQMVLSGRTFMSQLNLSTYRDLRKWLDDPFETLPLLLATQVPNCIVAWFDNYLQGCEIHTYPVND